MLLKLLQARALQRSIKMVYILKRRDRITSIQFLLSEFFLFTICSQIQMLKLDNENKKGVQDSALARAVLHLDLDKDSNLHPAQSVNFCTKKQEEGQVQASLVFSYVFGEESWSVATRGGSEKSKWFTLVSSSSIEIYSEEIMPLLNTSHCASQAFRGNRTKK